MLKILDFRRILGFITLIAAIATLAVIVRYFMESARKDKMPLSRSLSPDISMKTIHFTESHQNTKKWELFAQSGIYDKAKEKTSLENIRFIVERAQKESPVILTAEHGDYLHGSKTVQLNGNVLAKTDDGLTFRTPQITYDSAEQTLRTKDKVTLTDAGLNVEGIGMDLFVDRQQAMILNQVEATVTPARRK